jgi:hypothetical protein
LQPETNEDDHFVTLKVGKSAITSMDSGIARIHDSYMKDFIDSEMKLVELHAGKKKKVVKLVSDRLVEKNTVILRNGDMDDLNVHEGSEIELHPHHTMGEDMRASWRKFTERWKGKKEEV